MQTAAVSTREAARIELLRNAVCEPHGSARAFLAAARLSARTLKTARVGIWCFQQNSTHIQCQYLYDANQDGASEGEKLDLSTCPAYAAALRAHRVITAHDALHDPRTMELAPYLTRLGITSLMDCPIFEQGLPVGIVCHEHVGPMRTWTKEEAYFAATVSDMLGLYLEQEAAQRHYRALVAVSEELKRVRVMETVGRMAAGVAHDFNNVLHALGMCGEILRQSPQPTRELVDSMLSESQGLLDQGARLVRTLVDVSRKEQSEDEPSDQADVLEVVAELSPFLRTLAREGVQYEVRAQTERALVRLERSSVERIVTNLAVNARDAMLGGGRLLLEIGRRQSEQGPRVVLRISDTGVGMDDHTRERIFEPYFTTKPDGQGNGLGLAIVYRIVHDAGGSLQVSSSPGTGAIFTIELPAADAAPVDLPVAHT